MTASSIRNVGAFDSAGILAIVATGLVFGVWGAANAIDTPFQIQMYTLIVALVVGLALLIGAIARASRDDVRGKYENGVIKAGVIAAKVAWKQI